ncbi:Uncharacterised protein [Mycobacteroides abscessus subsp. abscessus]|nr:Uncharacterised protein [Mycobacteroides abscessus subsp. abscessus]
MQLNRAMVCGLYLQAIWKCLKPWSKVLPVKPAKKPKLKLKSNNFTVCITFLGLGKFMCCLKLNC